MADRTAVWLEAALNGPWARTLQPGMPITVGELVSDGIVCARAGAAIIHVHAYDERTGRQREAIDALTIAAWSNPANAEAKTLLDSAQ